jgi:hypothetical protein
MRHARNLRRVRYDKALFRTLIKKPSVALKYILRTAKGTTDTPSLPTDLSVLRDDITCRLITSPEEVITRLAQIETVALSPNPSLPSGAPFPWIGHIHPLPTASAPMIAECITPAIMLEALRRTPCHKGKTGRHTGSYTQTHAPNIPRGNAPIVSINGNYGNNTPLVS